MIARLIPIIVLTLLLPNLYIHYEDFRRNDIPRWRKILHWIPELFLLAGAAAISCTETLSPANLIYIGIYLLLYMLVALPKIAYVLTSLLLGIPGLFWHPFRQTVRPAALVARWAVFCAVAYGFLWGPDRLMVREADFDSPELPVSFDGYRIVQFSDVHLASFQHRTEQIDLLVDSINALSPDIIVFTGDLVNTDADELLPFMKSLSRLKAPDGVFSILGNHDYQNYARYLSLEEQAKHLEQLQERQQQMGWHLLTNGHAVLQRETDSIAVVGVENDGKPPFPERGNLQQALGTLPGYGSHLRNSKPLFKILLSHDPTHWRRKVLPETDIQLTLSGHTHGMQFMLFGWSPSQYIYPEWRGMYSENGRSLYVSLGVGGALIPFRFGAWPEINLITLHHK